MLKVFLKKLQSLSLPGEAGDEIRSQIVDRVTIVNWAFAQSFCLYYSFFQTDPRVLILFNGSIFMMTSLFWLPKLGVPRAWAFLISYTFAFLSVGMVNLYLGPESHMHLMAIPNFALCLIELGKNRIRSLVGMLSLTLVVLSLSLIDAQSIGFPTYPLAGLEAKVFRTMIDISLFILSVLLYSVGAMKWGPLLEEIMSKSKSLERQNEWNTHLLKTLSHDVKTPLVHALVGIRGATQGSEPLQQAERSLMAASEMLTNIEVYHQSIDGLELEFREFSLAEVLERVRPWYQNRIQEKNLCLKFLNESKEVKLVSNFEVFCHQVFQNVLSNAIKFSPLGGEIRLGGVPGPANCWTWTIEDEGVGLDDQDIAQMRQGNRGTLGEFGSGFGIKIIKKFAQPCGLQVQWNKRAPQGTQVVILAIGGGA